MGLNIPSTSTVEEVPIYLEQEANLIHVHTQTSAIQVTTKQIIDIFFAV